MSCSLSLAGRTVALAAVAVAAACSLPEPTLLSELDPQSYLLYARHIRPTEDESRWRTIPWLPTFAEGLRTAGEEQRPLLFWAMNGHPLGCT